MCFNGSFWGREKVFLFQLTVDYDNIKDSTLLDLIADRKLVGEWSGDILVNKQPRSFVFNRESAYVLQDDVHYASLTVEETIRYAAWTRMPEGTSIKDCEARVALLIKMMSLDSAKDNRVGDTLTKGISGGQQKRLSIAVEIIHLPQLIFLDEVSWLFFVI